MASSTTEEDWKVMATRRVLRDAYGVLVLPARRKLALVRVLLALATVEVGLRFLPADRLGRLVGVPLRLSLSEVEPPAIPALTAEGRMPELDVLARVLPLWPGRWATPCLRQALVIGILLRTSGPHLRLGVTTHEGEVLAHAWVEVAGRSFLGDPTFVSLGHGSGYGQ
jgi:hypothetical protein